MSYKVGLVGEQNYQPAIERCTVGEAAFVRHEPDNSYDNDALVAIDVRGATIGYVPRDNWLREAVHEEGQSCVATIATISRGGRGHLDVVLTVELVSGPIAQVGVSRAAATQRPGWLARLLGIRR